MGLITDEPTGKRPGKGVMLPLNGDVAALFTVWTRDCVPAVGAAGDFNELRQLLIKNDTGWQELSDSFGEKVYFEAGSYRLTLVKTAKQDSGRGGDLMVDIRNWS